jgi:chaperone required for assembly of F1-ATPase
MSEAPRDPMRAAQAHMRQPVVKRFYGAVDVREAAGGGHALTLDGRGARTPGRKPLAAKSRALMLKVAAEWERQGERVDPADMPLTRLVNSAVDGVAFTMAETWADIVRYAGSDLLCYCAEEAEALAERQRLAFDPILAWAAERLGARLRLGAGVVHVEQPPESIEAIRSAIEDFDDPVALAALSAMTTLTGSALLALAVARGRLSPEAAWRAAHIDEDFEIERWGADAEARARREARWREFEAAASAAGASG